jgi:hypothetical protein
LAITYYLRHKLLTNSQRGQNQLDKHSWDEKSQARAKVDSLNASNHVQEHKIKNILLSLPKFLSSNT